MVRALESRVRLSASPLLGNNPGQVVHWHVPLSPSSVIWYWLKGAFTYIDTSASL